MTWKTATINVCNESNLSFTPSIIHVEGTLDKFVAPPTNGGIEKITTLKPKDSAMMAFALIGLQSPDPTKVIGVYLSMRSDTDFLIFMVAVLDKSALGNPKSLIERLPKSENDPVYEFDVGTEFEFTDEKSIVHCIGVTAEFTSFEPQGNKEDEDENPLSIKEDPLVTVNIVDSVYLQLLDNASGSTGKAEFKIAAGPGHIIGQPIHETLSLCALIQASLISKDSTYDNVLGSKRVAVGKPDEWEYLRGVIWNDDPACLLFKDLPNNNGLFNSGTSWLVNFKVSVPILRTEPIIRRSHFGDLQFLHAMATKEGEDWEDTKKLIMKWLEVMYRLSIKDGVFASDKLSTHFPLLFNENTKPKGSQNLADLLIGKTTHYKKTDVKRRALGSCFHVIQDSYAIGHCDRNLKNPADMKTSGKNSFSFEPNTRFLEINNFHCYMGQDEHKHGEFDKAKNVKLLKVHDPNTFNDVVGARDAIEKCTKLAAFHKMETRWAGGVQSFLDTDVFKKSKNATKSNKNVGPGK